jgi:hypothetical protein
VDCDVREEREMEDVFECIESMDEYEECRLLELRRWRGGGAGLRDSVLFRAPSEEGGGGSDGCDERTVVI